MKDDRPPMTVREEYLSALLGVFLWIGFYLLMDFLL